MINLLRTAIFFLLLCPAMTGAYAQQQASLSVSPHYCEYKPLKLLGKNRIFCECSPESDHGKYGYANGKGRFVIPAIFDMAYPFSENSSSGFAIVKLGADYRILWRTGLLDGQLSVFPCYEYFLVRDGNKYGLLNKYGRVIIGLKYDRIQCVEGHGGGRVFLVEQAGLKGLIAENGEALVNAGYISVETCPFGYKVVSLGGSEGIFAPDGKILLAAVYSSARCMPEGILVTRDGKMGFFDSKAVMTVPTDYDSLLPKDGILVGKKAGVTEILAMDGKRLMVEDRSGDIEYIGTRKDRKDGLSKEIFFHRDCFCAVSSQNSERLSFFEYASRFEERTGLQEWMFKDYSQKAYGFFPVVQHAGDKARHNLQDVPEFKDCRGLLEEKMEDGSIVSHNTVSGCDYGDVRCSEYIDYWSKEHCLRIQDGAKSKTMFLQAVARQLNGYFGQNCHIRPVNFAKLGSGDYLLYAANGVEMDLANYSKMPPSYITLEGESLLTVSELEKALAEDSIFLNQWDSGADHWFLILDKETLSVKAAIMTPAVSRLKIDDNGWYFVKSRETWDEPAYECQLIKCDNDGKYVRQFVICEELVLDTDDRPRINDYDLYDGVIHIVGFTMSKGYVGYRTPFYATFDYASRRNLEEHVIFKKGEELHSVGVYKGHVYYDGELTEDIFHFRVFEKGAIYGTGLCDGEGNWIIKPYVCETRKENGDWTIYPRFDGRHCVVRRGRQYGVVDHKGKVVVPVRFVLGEVHGDNAHLAPIAERDSSIYSRCANLQECLGMHKKLDVIAGTYTLDCSQFDHGYDGVVIDDDRIFFQGGAYLLQTDDFKTFRMVGSDYSFECDSWTLRIFEGSREIGTYPKGDGYDSH